jgi:CRISPR system Cascade subunit CasA
MPEERWSIGDRHEGESVHGDTSFDLISQPWLRVRDRHSQVREVSLLDAYEHAHDYVGLAGELATQDVAVLRLLLAILRRSHPGARTHRDWERLWSQGRFETEPVASYLAEHRARFDLLHAETPFYQVAGLHTAKGELSGLGRLVADIPAGHPYFTVRTAHDLRRMSYGEAARWLVHAQAFEPSGIKSGAVGDDRVKGGKGYPIGVGWCGWLGTVVVEGGTLFRTLLLNMALGRSLPAPDEDLPVWERRPQGPGVEEDGRVPRGPVDLLTWQSRRIRLGHDEGAVTGVLIANGDPLHPRDRFREEFMTSWRLSETQMKALKSADPVYMPRAHVPDRLVWRGLAGLLARSSGDGRTRSGRWREWLAELHDEEVLGVDEVVRLRTVGMQYGVQSSVVDDVTDDVLSLHVAVLSDPTLTALAVDAVTLIDGGVRVLGTLAADLARAAGGDRDLAQSDAADAREQGYAALDAPYRSWVAAISREARRDDALRTLQMASRQVLDRLARQLLASASSASWSGLPAGPERKNPLNAATAANWFYLNLRAALPGAYEPEEARA